MRGHIRRRGRKWVYVIEAPAGEDGKRRQQWGSGFATKRDAQTALTEALGRMQSGVYIDHNKQTLAEFLTEWLASVKASVRPATHATYATLLTKHVVPALGTVSLQKLTPGQLNTMYADLLENGRRDGKGGLSTRTVRHVHTVLHTALMEAVRRGRAVRNVADLATPPKASANKDLITWTAAELRAFLAHIRGDRLYALYHLAATTGLRRGEVAGLTWRSLDLEGGRLSVSQTLISVDYRVLTSTPKTRSGRRPVALDPETLRVLREHRKAQLEERLALGGYAEDHDLVFCELDGQPLHPGNLSKRFSRLVRSSGLPKIRFHDLRHTHATLALQAGVHPKVVSERLGHADIGITLNLYSHVIPAMEEEAAAKVAALVFAN